MNTDIPDNYPIRYNGCAEPCDSLEGPCCCGAWHTKKDWDDWIKHLPVFPWVTYGQVK